MTTASSFELTTINEISPVCVNAAISGTVVRKGTVRTFFDAKAGAQKSILNFLIRDQTDSVWVVCWGALADSLVFVVGDYVRALAPRIKGKGPKSMSSTSQFELHLDEKMGSIEVLSPIHQLDSFQPLNPDLVPLKSLNDFVGREASFACLVGKVCERKDLVSKAGKPLSKITLQVFDQDTPSFELTFWDEDVLLTFGIKEHQTVLIFENIRIGTFQGTMQGTFALSSLMYRASKDHPASIALNQWISTNLQDLARKTIQFPSSEITTYYEIGELSTPSITAGMAIHGFITATLCSTNLLLKPTIQVCDVCHGRLNENNECVLDSCPSVGTTISFQLECGFFDHSGLIETMHLNGDIAERFLDTQASVFAQASEEDKGKIESARLWKTWKVFLKVVPDPKRKYRFYCVGIQPVDWKEALRCAQEKDQLRQAY